MFHPTDANYAFRSNCSIIIINKLISALLLYFTLDYNSIVITLFLERFTLLLLSINCYIQLASMSCFEICCVLFSSVFRFYPCVPLGCFGHRLMLDLCFDHVTMCIQKTHDQKNNYCKNDFHRDLPFFFDFSVALLCSGPGIILTPHSDSEYS